MEVSDISKSSFLLIGAWPAIISFFLGLILLICFQIKKKFRNFFGLAFLALPGCTLVVFGLLAIIYTNIEINNSILKVNNNILQIVKDNEADLVQKIQNGFYIDISKSLEAIKEKSGLSFTRLYLIPSNELIAQNGNLAPNHHLLQSIILTSKDIDGTLTEWGRLEFKIDDHLLQTKIRDIADHFSDFMMNMGLASLISSFLLAIYFFRHLKRPSIFVNNLRKSVAESKDVEDLLRRMSVIDYNGAFLDEERHLKLNLQVITQGMVELQSRWLKSETDAIIGRMASQVSHDIRSPLSALNMVVSSLSELPEDKRLIIKSSAQRINDIANLLLQRSKDPGRDNKYIHPPEDEPVMLTSLLDAIVKEKRAQFKERIDVNIQCDLSNGYGLFAKISPVEFSRMISNLINNSIEAFICGGNIIITILPENESTIITIEDDGKGIPKHIVEKLGQRGISFGKEGTQSGSGIGLFHAKATIEKADGKLEIFSIENKGTTIKIKLSKVSSPWWFIEKLSLKKGSPVVSLSDDNTFHQLWIKRLHSEPINSLELKHIAFASIKLFEEWLKKQESSHVRFLIDFEF